MDSSAQPQSTQPVAKGGIEPSAVSFGGIVLFLAGLVITAIFIHFVMRALFASLEDHARQMDRRELQQSVLPAVAASRTYFPSPREQISPQLDLQALRAQEEAELNSYGWVDRKAGVVRIPIERAMELLSQRGLPGGANAGPSSLQLQQQRPIQSSPPAKEEGK